MQFTILRPSDGDDMAPHRYHSRFEPTPDQSVAWGLLTAAGMPAQRSTRNSDLTPALSV